MYIDGESEPFVETVFFTPEIENMKGFSLYLLWSALLLGYTTDLKAQAKSGPEAPEPNWETSLQERYPTLLSVVQAADFAEIFENHGSFTVFAPSDAAFGKLGADEIRELLRPENKHRLKSLVAYHMVAGELTASKILKALCRGKGAARFTTVQGEELLATLEGSDIVLTDCSGNRARIVCADGNSQNLVFHEIDSVILPRPF